jgi:hypothetical protein
MKFIVKPRVRKSVPRMQALDHLPFAVSKEVVSISLVEVIPGKELVPQGWNIIDGQTNVSQVFRCI